MENTEIYTFDDFKKEARKVKVKRFLKSIPQKAKDLYIRDKELVLFLTPGVIYAVKRIAKFRDGRKEDHHRNCQVYDHSLGMWHDLKRPMKAREKQIYAQKRKSGESVLEVLTEMGLLS